MRSKEPKPSFLVPRWIGRSEADMVSQKYQVQLDLFREILTPQTKLQILAMLALSDPKHLDKPTAARVADIARTMGYELTEDGKFPGSVYEDIIKTGWKLKTRMIDVFFREPAGRTQDGRLKYKAGIRTLSILQEFQRYYEDDDDQPIDLSNIQEDAIIKNGITITIKTPNGEPPIYLIPMIDAKRNILRNADGTIRYRRASGIAWTWSSRFTDAMKDMRTAWVFWSDAIKILHRYLRQPSAFNLIFLTLFWINDHPEMSHEKIIMHLNISGKDQNQVNRSIDAAFRAALDEGIIDRPVQIREAGYYKPTKTGHPRRAGTVYQWHRASRWRVGKTPPMIGGTGEVREVVNEAVTEAVGRCDKREQNDRQDGCDNVRKGAQ